MAAKESFALRKHVCTLLLRMVSEKRLQNNYMQRCFTVCASMRTTVELSCYSTVPVPPLILVN